FIGTSPATPEIYPLSLHDALPIFDRVAPIVTAAARLRLHGPCVFHPAAFVDVVDVEVAIGAAAGPQEAVEPLDLVHQLADIVGLDRKSTRLNSSHVKISYAVFCLK